MGSGTLIPANATAFPPIASTKSFRLAHRQDHVQTPLRDALQASPALIFPLQ
jgi:hypothetical protein